MWRNVDFGALDDQLLCIPVIVGCDYASVHGVGMTTVFDLICSPAFKGLQDPSTLYAIPFPGQPDDQEQAIASLLKGLAGFLLQPVYKSLDGPVIAYGDAELSGIPGTSLMGLLRQYMGEKHNEILLDLKSTIHDLRDWASYSHTLHPCATPVPMDAVSSMSASSVGDLVSRFQSSLVHLHWISWQAHAGRLPMLDLDPILNFLCAQAAMAQGELVGKIIAEAQRRINTPDLGEPDFATIPDSAHHTDPYQGAYSTILRPWRVLSCGAPSPPNRLHGPRLRRCHRGG